MIWLVFDIEAKDVEGVKNRRKHSDISAFVFLIIFGVRDPDEVVFEVDVAPT